MERTPHAMEFLNETIKIASTINPDEIERLVDKLVWIRENGGRLMVLGVGGSAGNASHAVNDFRKLCSIEAYAPTDNVSELTARTNDEGWHTTFSEWLKCSKLNSKDAIFCLSVGGGSQERNVSMNLVNAADYAKSIGASVLGIVGRDGGHIKKVGDNVCVVPTVNDHRVTPHAEAYQAVIWHCLVSHPLLQCNATKW